MGIFNQLRKRVKDKQMDIPQPVGRGGGFFGGLPFAKERMPINDMMFKDPRFEPRRRRKGLAGLFGRMPRKLSERLLGDQVAFQPDMLPVQGMRPQFFDREYMPDFNMQGRMMMADGDEASTESLIDFLNSDQNQVDFGFVRNLVKEIIIDPGRTISDQERQMLSDALERNPNILSDQELSIVSEQMMKSAKPMSLQEMQSIPESRKYGEMMKGYAEGGEASFPDLTGDNKVTQADILKGRGVFAEGDEVSMMMMELEGDQGMSKSDMEGLEELGEISGPETEMLNNIINQIIELIAQGATEEEVIAFLRQQGLDEEDISAVMSMLSQQLTAGEESIDSQLAALG